MAIVVVMHVNGYGEGSDLMLRLLCCYVYKLAELPAAMKGRCRCRCGTEESEYGAAKNRLNMFLMYLYSAMHLNASMGTVPSKLHKKAAR